MTFPFCHVYRLQCACAVFCFPREEDAILSKNDRTSISPLDKCTVVVVVVVVERDEFALGLANNELWKLLWRFFSMAFQPYANANILRVHELSTRQSASLYNIRSKQSDRDARESILRMRRVFPISLHYFRRLLRATGVMPFAPSFFLRYKLLRRNSAEMFFRSFRSHSWRTFEALDGLRNVSLNPQFRCAGSMKRVNECSCQTNGFQYFSLLLVWTSFLQSV